VDDFTALGIFTDAVTSDEMLNNGLIAIANWAKIWLLYFNMTKCESKTFSVKITPSNTIPYFLNSIIKEVACHKHLGVRLNIKMNWANQTLMIQLLSV
jgi:hypothetical protein